MGFDIARGVFPTMITPFTEDHRIDYDAVDALVEYYARCGCAGVFADCQSSEMFYLSEAEKRKLTRHVVDAAKGRMQIVASGHTADDPDEQVRQLADAAEAGAAASVIVLNRTADQDDGESVARRNIERILTALPDVTFGVYECPHPYRRPLTDGMLEAMAETGRFSFIKDTCCDAALIARRLKVLDGRIQLFNANAATILDSLRDGADGFSGIMANYHPDLYVWLGEHFREQPEKARKLAAALSVMSAAEAHCHPVDAKYHMDRVGVPMRLHVRNQDESKFGPLDRRFVDDLIILEDAVRQRLAEK